MRTKRLHIEVRIEAMNGPEVVKITRWATSVENVVAKALRRVPAGVKPGSVVPILIF
jgi:hypothetical protein